MKIEKIYVISILAISLLFIFSQVTMSYSPTTPPSIVFFEATDPDGSGDDFSDGDTLTITFSDITNVPPINTKSKIDSLFDFLQDLGTDYVGKWINPLTAVITITNASGTINTPSVGVLTVTVKNNGNLTNAELTSVKSNSTSPVLTGSFNDKVGPHIRFIVADDPDNKDNLFSNNDTITVRFSDVTNMPSALTKIELDALFDFSQDLGANYTGQWVQSDVLVITIQNSTGSTPPKIGELFLTVNESANLKHLSGNSLASKAKSTNLIGKFEGFKWARDIGFGGTAYAPLPFGTGISMTLPSDNSGRIEFERTDAPTITSDDNTPITYIGNIVDISLTEGADCSASCEVSFDFASNDLVSANINTEDVNILHDIDDDGEFSSNEILIDSLLIPQPVDPLLYKITSQTNSTSKFAIGGIKTSFSLVVANFGGGASTGSQAPIITLDRLLATAFSIPEDIKKIVENHDPLVPINPVDIEDDIGIDFPLVIDDKGYLLAGYSNILKTHRLETQKQTTIDLTLYALDLEHVSFYINLRGLDAGDISKSDTQILYNKGKPIEVKDPHGYFDGETIQITVTKEGVKTKVNLQITPIKEMKKSDLIIRVWDEDRHSFDTRIFDALEFVDSNIDEDKLENDNQENKDLQSPNIEEQTNVVESTSEFAPMKDKIMSWGGYSTETISDSELLRELDINLNDSPKLQDKIIPKWIKQKMANWLYKELISEKDFVNAIQHIMQKRF